MGPAVSRRAHALLVPNQDTQYVCASNLVDKVTLRPRRLTSCFVRGGLLSFCRYTEGQYHASLVRGYTCLKAGKAPSRPQG